MELDDTLLRVLFTAPLENDGSRGLAVALVGGRDILVQIVADESGAHSCVLGHDAAVGLILALAQAIQPNEKDLARFRSAIEAGWTHAAVSV